MNTKNQTPNATRYVAGLLHDGLRNKSIERIAEADRKNYYSLQHFISDSQWSARELLDSTAKKTNEIIGGDDTALIIDESGMLKAGKSSVGVARQYLGCAGKVDNGQVGIFAALANEKGYGIIDAELYLPKTEWCENKAALDKAGVPEEYRGYRPVTQIALEMIRRAKANGVKYGYVVTDASYGKNLDFSWEIDKSGDVFMTDIACDTKIHLEKPVLRIPAYTGRGRKPVHKKPVIEAKRVDHIADEAAQKEWKRIAVRSGTKGVVAYKYLFLRPWFLNPVNNKYKQLTVIIRQDLETGENKYSVSNAPQKVDEQELADMQGKRYWVERAFQDAKSSMGMADYQIRKWNAWYHHMALVAFATFFVLSEKILAKNDYPLLSATDITEVLTVMLGNNVTFAEALKRIENRHKQRMCAMNLIVKKRAKPRWKRKS